jgi:methenyltetrahydromethanopterin cyclohydrolase
MTVKLNTTMQKYNEDGGNAKFIKTVTSALQIDQSLMKVTQLRAGSVIVDFTVETDGSISLNSLKN